MSMRGSLARPRKSGGNFSGSVGQKVRETVHSIEEDKAPDSAPSVSPKRLGCGRCRSTF